MGRVTGIEDSFESDAGGIELWQEDAKTGRVSESLPKPRKFFVTGDIRRRRGPSPVVTSLSGNIGATVAGSRSSKNAWFR
jgi:hypothetical protein